MNHIYPLRGFCYIIFSVFVWAGWIIISRYGVRGSLTAYDITAIRFTTAGICLLPLACQRGLYIPSHGIMRSVLLAFLMGAGYVTIAVTGMKMASASHASTVINGSVLIVTTTIGVAIMREHFSIMRLAGILVTLTGILLILCAKPGVDGESFPHQSLGHILFMVAGSLWGFYIILARKWQVDPLHATVIVNVISMLVYMPFYLAFADSHIHFNTFNEVMVQAVYQGILTAILAFMAFNKGIMLVGATRASSFIPLVPVISTVMAIPLLHEVPSIHEWMGVFTVSCGVLLASGVLRSRP